MRITFVTLLSCIGALNGIGCGTSRPSAQSVEGDVYLVMQSGDTKRGAGRTVYLIANPDSVNRAIANICGGINSRRRQAVDLERTAAQFMAKADAAKLPLSADYVDSAIRYRAAARAARFVRDDSASIQTIRVIFGALVAEAASGMNAHFRFDSVAPGEYALYADWPIGDRFYQWWAPIVLTPGASLVRDLDNSVEHSDRLACRG